MTRRDLLKKAVPLIGGLLVTPTILQGPLRAYAAAKVTPKNTARWVFVIDTLQCVGCGLCVEACKRENGVPYDSEISRTWVERYVVTRDGSTHIDSPKAGRDGFTDATIDLGEGHQQPLTVEDIEKAFFVPKLCNQCDNPPCVQVCPVGATYQTADGVVLIDRDWCIGCGYCIMSCPYGARYFHPDLKVADKCNFCYHRVSQGLKPACVEACPFGARLFGNLRDPRDPVTKIVYGERLGVLKEEYGTKPQVYYRGLSKEVR